MHNQWMRTDLHNDYLEGPISAFKGKLKLLCIGSCFFLFWIMILLGDF